MYIDSRGFGVAHSSARRARGLGLGERATRGALAVVVAAYEFHGGFRLRTLSA